MIIGMYAQNDLMMPVCLTWLCFNRVFFVYYY